MTSTTDLYARQDLAAQSALLTNRSGDPSQHGNWLDNYYFNLATSAIWTMPTIQYRACDRFMNAYAVINCDYFSGGGTLTVAIETAPILSASTGAWQTAGSATVSATGIQLIKILRTSSTPITGLVRLKVTCNTSGVAATLRVDLLLKEVVPSKTEQWLQATYINFTGSGFLNMPADQWLNMDGFLNMWLLVDYTSVSGTASNLTIKLQTAPAYSVQTSGVWQDVGTTLTMGTTPQIYDGRATVTNAPQGIIRLAFSASAALTGVLRVQALFKDK